MRPRRRPGIATDHTECCRLCTTHDTPQSISTSNTELPQSDSSAKNGSTADCSDHQKGCNLPEKQPRESMYVCMYICSRAQRNTWWPHSASTLAVYMHPCVALILLQCEAQLVPLLPPLAHLNFISVDEWSCDMAVLIFAVYTHEHA